jgi:hypothetical protein
VASFGGRQPGSLAVLLGLGLLILRRRGR